MTGRIVVVGLGPAGVEYLLPAARNAIEATPARYVRTARHPAVDDLAAEGVEFVSFDAIYDGAARVDDVYPAIAEAVLAAAAEHGTIVYAVPGNPAVAEQSVTLLHARAKALGVAVSVVPGLSFAELAWAQLGLDAADGTHLVDAHSVVVESANVVGRVLFVQCDSLAVLSDVKLALLETLPGEHLVTVMQRLGRPDESVVEVALAELDRTVEPDHLTSVFVDTGEAEIGRDFARFVELMETLRAPGGCPWDQEQTHASLRRYVLEEAYEVVEAISLLPPNAPQGLDASEPLPAGYASLEDELGDLLSQVVFHATLAREVGAFTIDDVIRGIHAKLVRRHPHVFGDVEADTGDDVMRNWEQIKKVEKGTSSIVEGITPDLPSLLYSLKLLRKAASVGLVVDDVSAAHEQAAASLEALVASPRADAAGGEQVDEIVGELLAAMVVIARARGVDAESALRGWSARYRDHFVRMEGLAAERELDLAALSPDAVAALWADAGD